MQKDGTEKEVVLKDIASVQVDSLRSIRREKTIQIFISNSGNSGWIQYDWLSRDVETALADYGFLPDMI